MTLSFLDLLAGLPNACDNDPSGTFRVQEIPGTGKHYIGRDGGGRPSVLLGSSAGRLHAPVRLAAIEAMFGVACRIDPIGAPSREEVLTVVTCSSSDVKVQEYFLHVSETLVRIVGPAPTQDQVVDAVRRLIDLFERLARPSSRSALGLAGELFLIASSRDPHLAARAWRSGDDDRFDFSIEELRLEVKASGSRTRAHHFSFEQCHPPSGSIGVLASVFIEMVGGGTSLQELILRIGRALADDTLFLKVQANVAETLGSALAEGLAITFDERLAAASMTFFDLATIPALRGDVPAELSEIRFRSSLVAHPPLSHDEVARRSELAARLLPRR